MSDRPYRAPDLYECGKCLDSGWEEIDTTGRGTVRRCPRGCDTPRHKAWVEAQKRAGK